MMNFPIIVRAVLWVIVSTEICRIRTCTAITVVYSCADKDPKTLDEFEQEFEDLTCHEVLASIYSMSLMMQPEWEADIRNIDIRVVVRSGNDAVCSHFVSPRCPFA